LTQLFCSAATNAGCVAVAQGLQQAPPGTGDSGGYAETLDFNEIIEGATVYLPVRVPAAALRLVTPPAMQQRATANSMERTRTSLDVEITVDVIPAKRIPGSSSGISNSHNGNGLDGSLDDAFRDATANMAQWLTERIQADASEVAQVARHGLRNTK